MKIRNYVIAAIVVVSAAIAVVGCNKEKSRAQTLVKDFLKENLVDKDFKTLDFSRLDSTKVVSDSMFLRMRENATENRQFKPEISYADGPKTKKLYFIRVKYLVAKDTIRQTFYLDDELSRVVSFKEG
ncbi:MAG: hypothetical protein IJ605_07610 [Prevotella sp.]|nr:hypothetical protein [Prevotella sp.]